MGELILHIGTRKTGTSALQKFFKYNREALLRNGVDYVQFTRQKALTFLTSRNGVFLTEYFRALVLQEEANNRVSDFEENYNRLANALKGEQRVLISDENFSNYEYMSDGVQYDMEKFWREAARAVKELGSSKTTVIVYLRRQDEYVLSNWKEKV